MHRIASTSSLRSQWNAADRDYDHLTNYLAKKKEFGPAFAALYAQPVDVADRRIDWYSEVGPELPVSVHKLGEDESARVVALASGFIAKIQQEAQRLAARGDEMSKTLQAASTMPQPLPDYVYWAAQPGAANGGQPILVGWGYVKEQGFVPHGSIEGTFPRDPPLPVPSSGDLVPPAGQPRPPDIITPSGPGAAGRPTDASPETLEGSVSGATPEQPGDGRVVGGGMAPGYNWRPGSPAPEPPSRWGPRTGVYLWALFGVLLLMIAALLLRACGIALPLSGLLGIAPWSYCERPISRLGDADRVSFLRSAIADMEARLAQREAQCAEAPPQSAGAGPGNMPSEQEIERRRQREGAEAGEVQVSLAWDGTADLDLSVVCPQGEIINFKDRKNCGGTLDVDMNSSERQSTTPVEHIVWPAGEGPPGVYRVRVSIYSQNADTRSAIPFVVELNMAGSTKTFRGEIRTAGRSGQVVTTFQR